MKTTNLNIDDIFHVIYWNKPTDKQKKTVLNIIEDGNDEMGIATDICDYLEIERRGNRRAIYDILTMVNTD